ncbi:four helix bundle protein [Saccharophagus degradans]|uniref:four helix bundle protein n=1 Tax=Saccharophagus degradans TaxID=86304 RepID=UPI00247813CB|nr:four helix bundle protein [Saccharophagus degradans]WGP00361.1 four helix bundle protein [Saccharophagus degradans]
MKFEKLDVWRRSAKLASDVYLHLRDLNDLGFKSQITRSVLSVSSNIAEGWERDAVKDRVRFLVIAKSSLAEFISQTYIGRKIAYIDDAIGSEWKREAEELAAMLAALISSVSKDK